MFVESESKIKQRPVTQFLMLEGSSPIEIPCRFKNVYNDSVFSIQHICKWYGEFKADRTSIIDERWSGWPATACTVELSNKIDALIQSDWKTRLSDIEDILNIFFGTVQSVVTKKLKYQKIYAHWIPDLLNKDQLSTRCQICTENLA